MRSSVVRIFRDGDALHFEPRVDVDEPRQHLSAEIRKLFDETLIQDPQIVLRSGFYWPSDTNLLRASECPFNSQFRSPKRSNLEPAQSQTLSGFWINSVFSSDIWNRSYFHWHRNFLTQLSYLLDRGFTDIRVVVAENSPKFKEESLLAMGLSESQIVSQTEVASRKVEHLVSVWGVDRQPTRRGLSMVRKDILSTLSGRLLAGAGVLKQQAEVNIFVKRGRVGDRRIINEAEVVDVLASRGDYLSLDLSELTYLEQINLFSRAKRIVGMHGGGLTNCLFAAAPQVLEFAATGHGWRPDFFPICNAVGGRIASVELASENRHNDVNVPIDLLEWWLDQESLRRNVVFAPGYFS